jgi:hypothetical protein
MQPGQKIGIAWYEKAEWERLRQAASDPGELDASFEEWELAAITTECEMRGRGMLIERVPIRATDLIAWCKRKRHPVNRSARSTYTAEQTQIVNRQGVV